VDHFGERRNSLADVREAVLQIRRKKSMVIDSADPNSRSAGSFFKNPVVSMEKLADLKGKFDKVPFFEFGTDVKIPAAWLIEDAGFRKGYVRGNVGISTNHSLAIINRGAATAGEMIVLKNEIQDAVRSRFDISLQPEPVMIGF
jgi:UDP-N-acetylmuramate dehydrogenase